MCYFKGIMFATVVVIPLSYASAITTDTYLDVQSTARQPEKCESSIHRTTEFGTSHCTICAQPLCENRSHNKVLYLVVASITGSITKPNAEDSLVKQVMNGF